MNGKELFKIIYDGELADDKSIKCTRADGYTNYIFREYGGVFNYVELMATLLNPEITFEIVETAPTQKAIDIARIKKQIEVLEEQLRQLEDN